MYGGDEPLHPILTALSVVLATLAGLAFGIAGFFVATVFPVMLRTALPGMTDVWFLALWTAAVALPLYGFVQVFRHGKGAGARAYASCGAAAIVILFAGELTGAITVYPWHARFYVVPGVLDRPASPSPGVRR